MREKRRPDGNPGGSRTIDHPQFNGPLLHSEGPGGNGFAHSTGIAREKSLAALEAGGYRPKDHGSYATALCPSHEDSRPSLVVYWKPGRIKIVCFAGCDEELDVLPALGLTWRDKLDAPRAAGAPVIDSHLSRRIEARRNMTAPQKATDDLLALPDLGERLCTAIARKERQEARPEMRILRWLQRDDEWAAAQPQPGDFPGGLPIPSKDYDPTPGPRLRREPIRPIGTPADATVVLALRDEVLQAIEVDGRTGLAWNLLFLNEQITECVRRRSLAARKTEGQP